MNQPDAGQRRPVRETMSRKEQSAARLKRKKILLVDDHPLMRRGQADLLNREPDFEVCGEAGTAREAMEAIAKLKPDLALVDMGLPDKDGLELIKDIQALHPVHACHNQQVDQMNEVLHTPAAVEPRNMKHRVFVIEDHPLMRRSLVEALEREPDLAVCGQAEDAQEAFAAIVSLQPDIVLTDIRLKRSSGLELIKALRAHSPTLPVVAITMFDVGRNERLARAAGAAGFVSKQDGPEKLIATVHEVLKGGKKTT